jgi:hypothetical protein
MASIYDKLYKQLEANKAVWLAGGDPTKTATKKGNLKDAGGIGNSLTGLLEDIGYKPETVAQAIGGINTTSKGALEAKKAHDEAAAAAMMPIEEQLYRQEMAKQNTTAFDRRPDAGYKGFAVGNDTYYNRGYQMDLADGSAATQEALDREVRSERNNAAVNALKQHLADNADPGAFREGNMAFLQGVNNTAAGAKELFNEVPIVGGVMGDLVASGINIAGIPSNFIETSSELATGYTLKPDEITGAAGPRIRNQQATGADFVSSGLDMASLIPVGRLAGIGTKGVALALKAGGTQTAKQSVKGQFAKGFAQGAPAEGAAEFAQAYLDNIAAGVDAPSITEALTQGAYGAALGGGMGGSFNAAPTIAQNFKAKQISASDLSGLSSSGVDAIAPVDIDASGISAATNQEVLDAQLNINPMRAPQSVDPGITNDPMSDAVYANLERIAPGQTREFYETAAANMSVNNPQLLLNMMAEPAVNANMQSLAPSMNGAPPSLSSPVEASAPAPSPEVMASASSPQVSASNMAENMQKAAPETTSVNYMEPGALDAALDGTGADAGVAAPAPKARKTVKTPIDKNALDANAGQFKPGKDSVYDNAVDKAIYEATQKGGEVSLARNGSSNSNRAAARAWLKDEVGLTDKEIAAGGKWLRGNSGAYFGGQIPAQTRSAKVSEPIPTKETKTKADGKPNPKDFADQGDYFDAVQEWESKQANKPQAATTPPKASKAENGTNTQEEKENATGATQEPQGAKERGASRPNIKDEQRRAQNERKANSRRAADNYEKPDFGDTGRKTASGNINQKSKEQVDKDMREYFSGYKNSQAQKIVSEWAANNEKLTGFEYDSLVSIFADRVAVMSKVAAAKLYADLKLIKQNVDITGSSAAQTLAMLGVRRRINLKNGSATKAEYMADVESRAGEYFKPTEAQQAELDAFHADFAAAGQQFQNAKNAMDELIGMSPSQQTDTKVQKAMEDFLTAQDALAENAKRLDLYVLEEIIKIHNPKAIKGFRARWDAKTENKKAAYEYTKKTLAERGIYMHSWVDSSILSNPVGRLFDILSGAQVLIESLTLGKLAAKYVASRRYANGHGANGKLGKTLEGLANRYSKIWADNRIRASLEAKKAGNVVTRFMSHGRAFTTSLVELGDVAMEGLAFSQSHQFYVENYIQKHKTQPSSKMADLMAMRDADGVHNIFKVVAIKDQGLGSRAYGMKAAMRLGIENKINSLPFFESRPWIADNAATFADRIIFGFWGVMKTLAGRGLSRALLGSPNFAKANQVKKRLEAKPDNLQLQAEYAATLKRAFMDGVSTLSIGGLAFAASALGWIEVTPPYPDDERERALMEAAGISPNSIRIGNGYYPIPRLFTSFAYPFMVGSSIGSSIREGKDPVMAAVDGTFALIALAADASGTENILNSGKTVLQGALGLVDATKAQDEEAFVNTMELLGTSATANILSQGKMFIPFSVLFNQVSQAFDPMKRETYNPDFFKNILNNVIATTPGRFALPVELDAQGTPVGAVTWWRRMVGATGNVANEDNAELQEYKRLQKSTGRLAYPTDRRFSMYDADDKKISFTIDQQMALDSYHNLDRADKVAVAMASDYYKGLTDDQKVDYLLKIQTDPSINANTKMYAKENGWTDVAVNIEGVNGQNTVEGMQILMAHGNMSESEKAKNLENVEYAAKYYEADYANKELNGTLTADDMDITKNGALYKREVAKFNLENGIGEDIIRAYNSTSNSTIEALLRTDREKAFGAVLYDVALAESGLGTGSEGRGAMKFNESLTVVESTDWELMYAIADLQYNLRSKNGSLAPNDREDTIQYGTTSGLAFRRNAAKVNWDNNVDPVLYQQYKDISKTDWEDLEFTNPELYERLWELDVLHTEAGVSLKSANHSEQKYYRSGGGSGYSRRSGGGGGGGGYSLSSVPSVSDLRPEVFTNRKGITNKASLTVSGNDKMFELLGSTKLKVPKTVSAGGGIKTKVSSYKAIDTVKYTTSKIRQPNMGDTYMSYLKGKSTQSSFRATRKYS